MTDDQIIRDYLEGTRQAFNLVTDWARAVVYLNSGLDGIAGDDVIAEVRFRLFLNLKTGKFKHNAPLKAYVQAITQHAVIDMIRRKERIREYLRAVHATLSGREDPTEALVTEDQLEYLLRVMSTLSEDCRTIWDMVLRQGLHYREIAELLGISEGAARTKASRCKDSAMAILEKTRDV